MLKDIRQKSAPKSAHPAHRFEKRPLSQGWSFRQVGTEVWYPATVPGCNFTDLLNNQLIDDPFYGSNEDDLQWVEKKSWEYRMAFDLSRDDIACGRADLVFHGLDTFAEVRLNGELILQSNNMFRTWKCNVCGGLVEGKNELLITFHAPLAHTTATEDIADFLYPAGNDHSEENLSVYIRKAPYHFGWDWGPRFVTSGIWRPITLHLYHVADIEDVQIQYELRDTGASVTLQVDVTSLTEGPAELCIICDEEGVAPAPLPIQLVRGQQTVVYLFDIDDVKRWWPAGMGDPYLYRFELQLLVKDEVAATAEKKIGFRTIEVVNEDDEWGQSFYFKVNGLALFAKGANYIPQDSFLDRIDDKRYARLFEDAVQANFNMLRVWGGGIYEDDRFYDLADEQGILIWQDFMFACTMYPSAPDFLENIRREAIENVKRLRNHPSIALWCGNNEIHMGWLDWGWQEEFGYDEATQEALWQGYLDLFEELLPSVLQEHDPERFYLPSSPISLWKEDKDFTIGDNHYWGVWHGEAPFEEYKVKIPRFMSEYGFQSFPLFQTVRRYTEPKDWYLTSDVMMLHQKHPRGNELIRKYLLREYKKPKDFESFLYSSQILQADGIRLAIEAHRRHKPYCMGTLYWQLNDCWPVASWSSTDYYGHWKALHYAVRNVFSNLLISCNIDKSQIKIHLVNDLHESFEVSYCLEIFDFRGHRQYVYDEATTLKANESKLATTLPIKACLKNADKRSAVAVASLSVGGKVVNRNHYLLALPKELKLLIPKFATDVQLVEDHFAVTISANTYARHVYLEFENRQGNFSDNFFDLLPGEEKVVTFPKDPTEKHAPKLIIKSLRDTYL